MFVIGPLKRSPSLAPDEQLTLHSSVSYSDAYQNKQHDLLVELAIEAVGKSDEVSLLRYSSLLTDTGLPRDVPLDNVRHTEKLSKRLDIL